MSHGGESYEVRQAKQKLEEEFQTFLVGIRTLIRQGNYEAAIQMITIKIDNEYIT